MQTIIFIAYFIIIGVLLSRFAGLVGLKVFKFSEIYNFFQRLLKKTEDR